MKRIPSLIALLVSGLALAFGLFIVGEIGLSGSDNIAMLVLGEMVDLPNWRLHMVLGGVLDVLPALAGTIAAAALLQRRRWGKRLWLGLMAWLMLFALIPNGGYSFERPDLITIAVVWCLGGLSFAVFLNKRISAFYDRPGPGLFSPVLALVVVSSLSILGLLHALPPGEVRPVRVAEAVPGRDELDAAIENAFMKKAMADLWGECATDFYALYLLYEEKDADAVIARAEELRKQGYADDRSLLCYLGEAWHAKGDPRKATAFFRRALAGRYLCAFSRAEGRSALYADAQLHYMLFLVYGELGEGEGERQECGLVEESLREFYGEAYTCENLARFIECNGSILMHYAGPGREGGPAAGA